MQPEFCLCSLCTCQATVKNTETEQGLYGFCWCLCDGMLVSASGFGVKELQPRENAGCLAGEEDPFHLAV